MINPFQDSFFNSYTTDKIPPLTVRKSVKESKKWQKAVLDGFESEGLEQFRDNLVYSDFYKMVEGEVSISELSEVLPDMSNMQDLLDGVGIPTFIKHYDLLGIIIRTLVGEIKELVHRFHIQDTGEGFENEYLRERNRLINDYLKNRIETEVDTHLAKEGYNQQEQRNFESEEEQQEYLQKLEQVRSKYTPKDIERKLSTSWKSKGLKWAEGTIHRDSEKYNLERELDPLLYKDKLLTGNCFLHYRVSHDFYKPERWSPINTFFSKTVDTKYADRCSYIGRVHYQSPKEVIQNYGTKISSDIQKKLLGGNENWKSFINDSSTFTGSNIGSQKHYRVPHENYLDYNYALNLQDVLDQPLGEYTSKGGRTGYRYFPKRHGVGNQYGSNNLYAKFLRTDLDIKDDLCQVTEVYFIAYDLVGYLTYENDYGRLVTEFVTEDILPQFLKDNNIKQTYKESFEEAVTSFEVNTLKWTYKPVGYEGLKITSQNLEEPIYLYCNPLEYQIKGDSDFDVRLPVAGYIGDSLANRINPYQVMYNICMNQKYDLLGKELGMFFLMDIQFIPSEFSEYGDTEEALNHLRDIAKNTGILPMATSGDAQKDSTVFNQFSTQNITFVPQLQSRMELAEYYKGKALEIIGVNPQRLGQANKYTTDEGIKVSQDASYAQTSELIDEFMLFKKSYLELHLAVAQYCQGSGKDLSLMYTKGDGSLAFLKENNDNLPFCRFGLVPSDDNQQRKKLLEARNILLNNNTLGADSFEIIKLLGTEAYSDLKEIARVERVRKDRLNQEKQQHEQNLTSQQIEATRIENEEKYIREEKSKDKDRYVKIETERINALGRASDKNSDSEGIDTINQQADLALKYKKFEADESMAKQRLKREDENAMKEYDLKIKKFNLEAMKIKQQQANNRSKEFVATVNKN